MTPRDTLKAAIPDIVGKHARRSDTRAALQILNTCLPFLLQSFAVNGLVTAVCTVLAALFIVRIFMMMHDCGHRSLFRTQRLNAIFAFVTGVLCGMPQDVWSQHHNYHHATNGNWSKYTGPLGTISVDAFARLSPWRQPTSGLQPSSPPTWPA